MSYVILWVNQSEVENARKEYMNLIWQDNEPAGFEIRFIHSSSSQLIFGHLTRLDNDQCDWLVSLPKYISYSILNEEINSDIKAQLILENTMLKLQFKILK
jgi:hypothetical protein